MVPMRITLWGKTKGLEPLIAIVKTPHTILLFECAKVASPPRVGGARGAILRCIYLVVPEKLSKVKQHERFRAIERMYNCQKSRPNWKNLVK
jgi:hypothetical protein